MTAQPTAPLFQYAAAIAKKTAETWAAFGVRRILVGLLVPYSR